MARHPFPLVAAEAEKLVARHQPLADEPALGEMRTLLARAYGDRMSAAILDTSTVNLTRRLRACAGG